MMFETFTRASSFSKQDSASDLSAIACQNAKDFACAKAIPVPKFDNEEHEKLRQALEELFERYRADLAKLEKQDQSSFIVNACLASLRTRVPRMLHLATVLLESLYEAKDKSQVIIAKLRSSFQIARVRDYLVVIEGAQQDPPRGAIDQNIAKLVELKPMQALAEEVDLRAAMRVSLWSRSSLNLEMPAGMASFRRVEKTNKTKPVSVHVEPFFVFKTSSLLEGLSLSDNLAVCQVDFEEVKHTPLTFNQGAGKIGQCIVRVRLDPLYDSNAVSNRIISVDEARVIQRNAYPPRPRANVDVYVSTFEGERSITVTMIIDTYTTRAEEEPRIHIDLCLAH